MLGHDNKGFIKHWLEKFLALFSIVEIVKFFLLFFVKFSFLFHILVVHDCENLVAEIGH